MTIQRVPHPARTKTPESFLLDRIEWEIGRLREKRPALSDRIDRASNIIIQHLACPRQRPIRVRISGGEARFLVEGTETYTVNPADWSCTCPDAVHRDHACKHAIACYLLFRVTQPKRQRRSHLPCQGCGEVLPRRQLIEVQSRDHEMFWPGDQVCRPCGEAAGVEW